MQLDLTGSGRLKNEHLLSDRETWSRLLAAGGGPEVIAVQLLGITRAPGGDQVTVRLLLEDEPEASRGLGAFWMPIFGAMLGLGALFGLVWGVKSATGAILESVTPLALALGGAWLTHAAWGEWWPGMLAGAVFFLYGDREQD